MTPIERGTVVVLTHNRRVQLLQTLRALLRLPDGWPVIVVDNGSADGTSQAVSSEFPQVLLIRCHRNIGAAARNIGLAYVHTPYVAFCDDDTQWESGSLDKAGRILDFCPQVAILNACVRVGESGRIDPACQSMAHSPLDRENLPGPQLLGFMAGACVVRTRAFYETGGYWPPLFIGGEEALVALDLVDRGWRIVYVDDVVTRHFPSRLRNSQLRERLLLRNAIWVAWLRLPVRQAWRESAAALAVAARRRLLRKVTVLTLGGMLTVLRERRVVSPRVAAMRALLWEHEVAAAGELKPASSRRSIA